MHCRGRPIHEAAPTVTGGAESIKRGWCVAHAAVNATEEALDGALDSHSLIQYGHSLRYALRCDTEATVEPLPVYHFFAPSARTKKVALAGTDRAMHGR